MGNHGSRRSRAKAHLADMTVSPEQRHRKRKTKGLTGKGRIAQMDRANGSEQDKRRREWFRKNKR